MKKVLICLLVLRITSVTAQQIELPGVVVIQNSEYETGHKIYVRDASIRAPFAKAVTTDKQGHFALAFAGVAGGTPVRVTVEKTGMQVVNASEMEQVILGRLPELKIVMADGRKLGEAQARFYSVTTTSIQKNYDRRMAALRADNVSLEERLAALGGEEGKELSSLEEAIDLLTTAREQALEQASDLAHTFATVDLDEASDLYRQGYEALRRGAVDSALMLLDPQLLEQQYAAAREQKQRGEEIVTKANTSIRQLYASYELKTKVLMTVLAYKQCADTYERMGGILRDNSDVFPPLAEADLLGAIAEVKYILADYEGVLATAERALAIRSRELGEADPSCGRMLVSKGEALMELGKLDSAIATYDRAIAIAEANGDAGRKLLADAKCDLGVARSRKGDAPAARQQYEESLALRTGLFGPHHPDVAICLNNLGDIRRQQGAYADAMKLYAEALASLRDSLPEAHPLIATVHSNMGTTMTAQGDLEGAMREIELARDLFTRSLGPGHPTLGLVTNQLADIYFKKGDYKAALSENTIALETLAPILGPDHPLIGIIYVNRGSFHELLGQYAQALQEEKQAQEILEKALGVEHPNLAVIHNNLGRLHQSMDEFDAAIDEFKQAIAIYSKTKGPEHPDIASFTSNLAMAQDRAGRYDEAMDNIDKAIAISTKALGPEHASTFSFQANRFAVIGRHGDRAIAVAGLEELLPRYAKVIAPDHPTLGICYMNLGIYRYELGDLDKADNALKEAYRITPSGQTSWQLYLVARDRHEDDAALDWLIKCARKRRYDPKVKPADRELTLNALNALAMKLGRKDVLEEFKWQ